MNNIKIVPLQNTRQDINKFVKSKWKFYQGNQYWVPPIISDQVKFIQRGPFREFGLVQPFLALRDDEIVGRITAHIDNRHNRTYKEKRGCFGFFECIDDPGISCQLFKAAEMWLKEQGMDCMEGPYNFAIYNGPGILLDDYNTIPALELAYNPAYYPDLCIDYGLEKKIDWYAYIFNADWKLPKLFYQVAEKVKKNAAERKDGFVIRNADLSRFDEEKLKIRDIFNVAWQDNWGHIPFTEKQWEILTNEVKQVVKSELCILAEYNGEMAGFILSIPDVNLALKRANGRLFPIGYFKILLGMKKINRLKTYIMGVLPKYRMRGIETYFIVETIERGKKLGYVDADMSLIVETNISMRNALEHMGAKIYKTYRIYWKKI